MNRSQSKMNINIVRLIILVVFFCQFGVNVFSQGRIWFSELGVNILQEQKMEWIGGSIKKSPALGYFINVNNGGKKVAVGIQFNYSKPDLKNTNTPGVEKNSLKLYEFYFVMRYYPMLPTMRLGTKFAFRFTAGGMAGGYSFYWKGDDGYGPILKWSPLQFCPTVFAGLCLSPFYNTTGVCVKLNYSPQTLTMQNFTLKNFTLKQPFLLSASIFIGSKIK